MTRGRPPVLTIGLALVALAAVTTACNDNSTYVQPRITAPPSTPTSTVGPTATPTASPTPTSTPTQFIKLTPSAINWNNKNRATVNVGIDDSNPSGESGDVQITADSCTPQKIASAQNFFYNSVQIVPGTAFGSCSFTFTDVVTQASANLPVSSVNSLQFRR